MRYALILIAALFVAIFILAFPAEGDPVEAEKTAFDPADTVYWLDIIGKTGAPIGNGSAVYIGNGYFVTAAHVVKDVTVNLRDVPGEKVNVMWRADDYDIALLKVDRMWPDKPAANVSCEPLKLGDKVRTIGYPLGDGYIFNGFGRIGNVAPSSPSMNRVWKKVAVTDALMVYGMSGGGVFSEAGDLIGIIVGVRVIPMGMGASLTGINSFVPAEAVCSLMVK